MQNNKIFRVTDQVLNNPLDTKVEDYHVYFGSQQCKSDTPKRKLHLVANSGLRKSPNKWTKEENQKLAMLVTKYGEKKWKRISAEMGGQKTGAHCAQHWKRVLSPDIRKGPWDEDEESLLFRMVTQYGSCWKKIAKKISRRTDIQCRYQYLKAKQSREIKWTPREDDALAKKVMEMFDKIIWLEVAEYLAKLKHTTTLRTALECKERYLVLAGVDDFACAPSRADTCGPMADYKSENSGCSGTEQESFFPSPRRVDKNNNFKEYGAGLQTQLATESGARSALDLGIQRQTHVCSSCTCCSSCSGHRQEGWDCLESLAAVASVLPREMLY